MGESHRNWIECVVWILVVLVSRNHNHCQRSNLFSHHNIEFLAGLEGNVNHCKVYICPSCVCVWYAQVESFAEFFFLFLLLKSVRVGCLCRSTQVQCRREWPKHFQCWGERSVPIVTHAVPHSSLPSAPYRLPWRYLSAPTRELLKTVWHRIWGGVGWGQAGDGGAEGQGLGTGVYAVISS